MNHYLGIEIGGTKLQLGVGADDGVLAGLWRGAVDVAAGPEGIRRQITAAVPELLAKANLDRSRLKGVGIGFGGPVDDATHTVIKSHQIEGWDNYPLADWVSEVVGLPAALGNDADVAGLAEALHGAGKGYRRSFTSPSARASAAGSSSTVRSIAGWGGGRRRLGTFVSSAPGFVLLEQLSSGWAIGRYAGDRIQRIGVRGSRCCWPSRDRLRTSRRSISLLRQRRVKNSPCLCWMGHGTGWQRGSARSSRCFARAASSSVVASP